MGDGQGEAELDPDGEPASPARRAAADGTALLLAVERVGADVAAITVRVGALDSLVDQLRLSLLAGLDRVADRLDHPLWLAELRTVLGEVALARGRDEELSQGLASLAPLLDDRLDRLTDLVSRLAADRPPPDQAATVTGFVETRLDQVTAAMAVLAERVKAGDAVADALEMVGRRLAAVEATAGQMATDSRQTAERVAPLADRLGAIAVQVDRITPLARAGDEAGSLLGTLDRVSAGLDEVVAGLLRSGLGSARAGAPPDGDAAGRSEAVIEVLAGVSRRQDEVTAAVTSVLDQVRGPLSVEAVLDRMEQRERSLAARLDRIDAELRQRPAGPPGALVDRLDERGAEDARLLATLADWFEHQERAIAGHLGVMGEHLAELAAERAPGPASPPGADDGAEDPGAGERPAALIGGLAEVARRQDELAAAMSGLVDQARGPLSVEAVFDRMDQRERSLAARLDRIEHHLRSGVSTPAAGADQPPGSPPIGTACGGGLGAGIDPLASSVDAVAAATGDLAALIESTAARLDRRLVALESGRAPAASAPRPLPAGATEAAARRLAELRAERARVQARLQEERLLAAEAWDNE